MSLTVLAFKIKHSDQAHWFSPANGPKIPVQDQTAGASLAKTFSYQWTALNDKDFEGANEYISRGTERDC